MTDKDNTLAVIGLGSNIDPETNTIKARDEVGKITEILKASEFQYTKPLLFTKQPDFLNGVLLVRTKLEYTVLRDRLKEIEIKMGRKKHRNKNGPRIIDLDILIYDGQIVDIDVYKREFLKESILEVMPDFTIA